MGQISEMQLVYSIPGSLIFMVKFVFKTSKPVFLIILIKIQANLLNFKKIKFETLLVIEAHRIFPREALRVKFQAQRVRNFEKITLLNPKKSNCDVSLKKTKGFE